MVFGPLFLLSILAEVIFFAIYCIHFELAFQFWFGIVVCLVVVVLTFYFAPEGEYSFSKPKLLIGLVIMTIVVGYFTFFGYVTTPTVSLTDSMSCNMGVIVDRKTQKVVQVVFPNESPLSEHGVFFMKSPNMFHQNVEWFDLHETILEIPINLGVIPTKATLDIVMVPIVQPGDILVEGLKSEAVYRQKIVDGLPPILTECMKSGVFEHGKFVQMIAHDLSNQVFMVKLGTKKLVFTSTYDPESVDWGKQKPK